MAPVGDGYTGGPDQFGPGLSIERRDYRVADESTSTPLARRGIDPGDDVVVHLYVHPHVLK